METVKLKPAIKNTIWAGTKLKKYKNYSDYSSDRIAECWELSFHKDGPCIIDSSSLKGKVLKDVATKEDVGEYASSLPFFPVLIKIIDSGDNLSVQVHPSDDYALKNENSFGKTEMWHVLSCEEGSGLYVGLKEDSSKEEIEKALKDGTILDKLNFVKVKPGENYFIKSGTIHAIGKGVTVIEIQQNSNLTYRLYDYNRVDKNGKPRELHIEKALKVIDYHKYKPVKFKGNCIGRSKYFASYLYNVNEKNEIDANKDSFVSITFIEGEGKVNDIPYHKLDSFFIPANKSCKIFGNGQYVLTTVEKPEIAIGVDIGGMSVKVGFVKNDGKILSKSSMKVVHLENQDVTLEKLGDFINQKIEENGYDKSQIIGIGIGCPGCINSKTGYSDYSNNLGWLYAPVGPKLKEITGLDFKISNDANVACLGEAKFGIAKNRQNVVMLTLGTGVGGGLVLNGKLYEGVDGKGAELGHVAIELNGRECTCTRRGCLEAYASVSALIKDTKAAMEKNHSSIMWKEVNNNLDNVDGKTAFEASKLNDKTANEVVNNYIYYLGEGLLNFCNVFRPEVIVLGGGLSNQGKYLTDKLNKYLKDNDYGFKNSPEVEVVKATLGNDAGIIGAASLFF